MRNAPDVRFIKAETICIGDTLRVRTKVEDVTREIIGTVKRRDHSISGTEYLSAKGVVILFVPRDNLGADRAIIVLLERKTQTEPEPLF